VRILLGEDVVLTDSQQQYWDKMLADNPGMFGDEPSFPAREAMKIFTQEGKTEILELGAGQGRDTVYFARQGLNVCVVDYAPSGVSIIRKKVQKFGLTSHTKAICHDVRTPLPFADNSFDAVYSHMLFCMALRTSELEVLFSDVLRVLKPGGLNIYTVRHTGDAHYKMGIHRGEDMFEVGGFVVHFFSADKVKHLSQGYSIEGIDEFEEGELPRKLFLVKLRK
jgi:SAM-dependent methyltransferase